MAKVASLLGIGRSELILIVLVAMICVVGTGQSYVIPYYLLGIQASYGVSVSQLGFIPGIENLAIGVGCMVTGFFLRRGHAVAVAVAAAVCVVGNLASLFARDFASIFAVRALIGLAGEGPLYAISYMVVGAAISPDRALGVAMTTLGLTGAVILLVQGPLTHAFGAAGVLLPFGALAAGLFGWVVCDRSVVRVRTSTHTSTDGPKLRWGVDLKAAAIILSVALLTGVACAMSAFTGTAAQATGVRADDISKVLSLALVLGLAGGMVPAVIGDRFGRVLPVAFCSVILIPACILLVSGGGVVGFAIAATIIPFSWGMNAVYQLSGLVARDNSGRYATFGAIAQMAGMAVGPPIFGSFIASFGYPNLPYLVMALSLPGVALFVLGTATRLSRESAAVAGVAAPE